MSAPVVMNDLRKFIQKYREQSFPHCEALFLALDKGEANLHGEESDPIPCAVVLGNYKRRAEHLRTLGSEGEALLADVAALCEELEKVPDELVQGWIFEMPPNYLFYVFEGVNSKRILGCSLGIDKRVVDNDA